MSAETLRSARGRWSSAAEELEGGWRRLDRVSTGGLASEVVAAVESFRSPWVDELRARAVEAQERSDAILSLGHDLWASDDGSAGDLRSLMLWARPGARPESGEQ